MNRLDHEAKHGPHVCDRFTDMVFDVWIDCPDCHQPMDHHCCHKCCLTCGVEESGRRFAGGGV